MSNPAVAVLEAVTVPTLDDMVVLLPLPLLVMVPLSNNDVDTEENEDLDDDEVEGVALLLIRSVSAEMGNVEGGKAELETESSSE